ncbi:MAG TPA: SDR family NAD(P)-dependent oxidoreductase [Gammaproteobacteria bacterium]|nr:SDR family NAD(P)-dependent oxidoreductase [Gammaproteobacteria bacterium]
MINRYIVQIVPSSHKNTDCLISVNHSIAITNDKQGIAEALAKQFIARGYHHTQVVDHVSPASDVVIALDGLSKFSNLEEAIRCNFRVFQHAHAVAERFTQRGGHFITVQATGGNFSFNANDDKNAWTGGIAALVKTASQEWPKAICQAIDLEICRQSPNNLADILFQQLFKGYADVECGLLANGKVVTNQLAILQRNTKKVAFPIDKNAVIVASGGARGITAVCLLALAKQYQPRIILLGRTHLVEESLLTKGLLTEQEIRNTLILHHKTNQQSFTLPLINEQTNLILAQREIKTNLALFKTTGADVMYVTVDILNDKELVDTLSQIRKQYGKITGILHGAGVLADKLIAQKTEQQFERVFNTKVQGLKNILAATHQDKINFLILFSSVAARFGNVGQCDYAMANEVLNKVAQQEQQNRGKTCLVKSLNWGPWESGMVTPLIKALFQQRGIGLLSTTTGTEMFLSELIDAHRQPVEVILNEGQREYELGIKRV